MLEGAPPQILLGKLSVRGIFGLLLRDGLDGFRAIDRFLRSRNSGEAVETVSRAIIRSPSRGEEWDAFRRRR